MSKDRSATRREFLGTATAATAATLVSSTTSEGQESGGSGAKLPEFKVAQADTETPSPEAATQGDWSKPQAMAIPKEGYFKLEQGRYGPIYPRTPANYGFTIIAKVKPGREEAIREHGKTIEAADENDPVFARAAQTSLSPLGLVRYRQWHALHVSGNFRYRLRQVPEDAVALFLKTGINYGFCEPRRMARGLENEPAGSYRILPPAPVSELSRIWRVSLCNRG